MKLDDIHARIGIPPHTKLAALFRMQREWHVWIAVRDMQQPYSQWEGTRLILRDNGSVTRVTTYEDGSENVMEIKE